MRCVLNRSLPCRYCPLDEINCVVGGRLGFPAFLEMVMTALLLLLIVKTKQQRWAGARERSSPSPETSGEIELPPQHNQSYGSLQQSNRGCTAKQIPHSWKCGQPLVRQSANPVPHSKGPSSLMVIQLSPPPVARKPQTDFRLIFQSGVEKCMVAAQDAVQRPL